MVALKYWLTEIVINGFSDINRYCREAFSGFDAEIVAKFTEKKIASISAEYGLDISQVRGVVDNSNRILEVMQLSFHHLFIFLNSHFNHFFSYQFLWNLTSYFTNEFPVW
jgi:3-methyladenine DNA glycosylase Tag